MVGPPSAWRAGPSPWAARLSPLQGSVSALPPPSAKVPAGQRPTQESFPQLPSGTAGGRTIETHLRDLLRVRYAPPTPLPSRGRQREAAVPSGGSPSAPPPPQPAATAASLPHLPTSSLLRGEEQLVHFPVWARGNIRARYSARFVTDPVPRLPRERGPVGPR